MWDAGNTGLRGLWGAVHVVECGDSSASRWDTWEFVIYAGYVMGYCVQVELLGYYAVLLPLNVGIFGGCFIVDDTGLGYKVFMLYKTVRSLGYCMLMVLHHKLGIRRIIAEGMVLGYHEGGGFKSETLYS